MHGSQDEESGNSGSGGKKEVSFSKEVSEIADDGFPKAYDAIDWQVGLD